MEAGHDLFEAAFRSTTVGVSVTALDLTIQRSNAALQAMLGRTEEELVGRRAVDFTHPDDRALTEQERSAMLRDRRPGRFEKRYVRPDGTIVWADVSVAPIFDAAGTPVCFVSQALDVTARRATEAALERERRLLADAETLAHVGSWEWDVERDELVASAELARIFGRDPDDPSADWMAAVHPDDRARIAPTTEETLEERETESVYRIVRPDGEVRWVRSRRRGLPDGRLVGTVQDITERREADQLRREAETLYAQTIEQAPAGMALVGLDGRFLRVNPALCELTGYAADELVTMRPTDLTPAEDHERDREGARRLIAGEIDEYTVEKRYLRRDGDEVWTLLSVCLLRDADGVPQGYISSMQDVTDRRKAAEALAASERAAHDASRMKSQFLANMSHEIRTPMNGVLGMIDALLHSSLTPEQRGHAETARRSAESLLTIIDDVLDFSKVEAGRLELEESAFDLLAVLEETHDLLWDRARGRGLVLLSNVDPAVPRRVVGDAGRLRQILVNLLTNAIKFSKDGQILLVVGDDGDDRLRFTVTDPGVGIAPEVLERLFSPFTQADASTTRRFGGTGLGLAISRQLAELMGGAIGAASVPGEGSTFWFTARLPAAGGVPADERILDGLGVLLCAQDADARDALGALLARWGAEVTAATPEQAPRAQLLAAARGAAPAVAVLADPDGTLLPGPLVRQLGERAPGGILPALVLDLNALARDPPPGVRVLRPPFRRAAIGRLLAELAGREVAAESAPSAPASPAAETQLGTGRRILVAEDHEVNQQVALVSLRRRGFAVDIAADGVEAVERVADGHYDLILMDCQMPRMDGFAATAEIRKRQAGGAATPIIAMTASSMNEDRERCLAAGMDDFVAKPVRPEELSAVLARWLR